MRFDERVRHARSQTVGAVDGAGPDLEGLQVVATIGLGLSGSRRAFSFPS